jgi:hypothetical protein
MNFIHLGHELSDHHREDVRKMLFDNFPELLQSVEFRHASRSWDNPINTTCPMRRQMLNRLSPLEQEGLNQNFKDAVDARLDRIRRSEFGSSILFATGSLRM